MSNCPHECPHKKGDSKWKYSSVLLCAWFVYQLHAPYFFIKKVENLSYNNFILNNSLTCHLGDAIVKLKIAQ